MDEKPTAPVLQEIAASEEGRDITLGFLAGLGRTRPMQDAILAARGGGLELYEEVLRDWQAFSTFQQRRSAVVSREWEVVAGAEDRASVKAADSLRAQLEALRFDGATDKMLYGVWYGYATAEMLWARDGGEIVIDRIKVKKARRFRFDNEGRLRLLTATNAADGEEMPARKFWTYQTGADNDDDPYGLGLGHYCYWPVWFKKNGIKFWAMLLDKFGGPTGVGKYPAGASPEEQKKLLAAVAAIQSSSGVIIPEGMLIEFLEASRTGSVGNDGFVDRMDAAIAKVVLSQTMTTDNGSSRSQGEVHEGVKEDVVKADADLVCSSFNAGPARWLTDWNYPGATPPKLWRRIEPPEDLDKLADRDTKIFALGFEPSADYIRDTYGEGWTKSAPPAAPLLTGLPGASDALARVVGRQPTDAASTTTEGGPAFAELRRGKPAFAELDPRDTAGLLARQADETSGLGLDALIEDIREILDTSPSLDEFHRRLLLAYPKISVADLAAVVRDALIAAELNGRADQDEG